MYFPPPRCRPRIRTTASRPSSLPRGAGQHILFIDDELALVRLRPDLPVMPASGLITNELQAEAASAGMRELLGKPYSPAHLCAIIHRILQTDPSTD